MLLEHGEYVYPKVFLGELLEEPFVRQVKVLPEPPFGPGPHLYNSEVHCTGNAVVLLNGGAGDVSASASELPCKGRFNKGYTLCDLLCLVSWNWSATLTALYEAA